MELFLQCKLAYKRRLTNHACRKLAYIQYLAIDAARDWNATSLALKRNRNSLNLISIWNFNDVRLISAINHALIGKSRLSSDIVIQTVLIIYRCWISSFLSRAIIFIVPFTTVAFQDYRLQFRRTSRYLSKIKTSIIIAGDVDRTAKNNKTTVMIRVIMISRHDQSYVGIEHLKPSKIYVTLTFWTDTY